MCRRTDIRKKISSNILIVHMGFEINGVPSPCHIWTGSHSGDGRGGGYPRMSLDGQTVAVHIVAFTNKNGFVPGKKQIDHMCNNRLCVNEDHLQMVTHKKNQQLRIQKSRKASDVAPTHPAQHCELRSNGTPVHDRGREDLPELGRVQEDEEAGIEGSFDGRYPPDHAFWSSPADVLSGPSHPTPEGG